MPGVPLGLRLWLHYLASLRCSGLSDLLVRCGAHLRLGQDLWTMLQSSCFIHSSRDLGQPCRPLPLDGSGVLGDCSSMGLLQCVFSATSERWAAFQGSPGVCHESGQNGRPPGSGGKTALITDGAKAYPPLARACGIKHKSCNHATGIFCGNARRSPTKTLATWTLFGSRLNRGDPTTRTKQQDNYVNIHHDDNAGIHTGNGNSNNSCDGEESRLLLHSTPKQPAGAKHLWSRNPQLWPRTPHNSSYPAKKKNTNPDDANMKITLSAPKSTNTWGRCQRPLAKSRASFSFARTWHLGACRPQIGRRLQEGLLRLSNILALIQAQTCDQNCDGCFLCVQFGELGCSILPSSV